MCFKSTYTTLCVISFSVKLGKNKEMWSHMAKAVCRSRNYALGLDKSPMASIVVFPSASRCELDALGVVLSSTMDIWTFCAFVWPCDRLQPHPLGNKLFPTLCSVIPFCPSSLYSKGFLRKRKSIVFSVRKLGFRPALYFLPWTNYLTSLSLRLLTYLLVSYVLI